MAVPEESPDYGPTIGLQFCLDCRRRHLLQSILTLDTPCGHPACECWCRADEA